MAKCCQWWSQGISRVFHLSIQASDSIFLTVHLPGGWKSMMWWSSAGNAGEDFFPRIGHSGKTFTGKICIFISGLNRSLQIHHQEWSKNHSWSTKLLVKKHLIHQDFKETKWFSKKKHQIYDSITKITSNDHTNLAEKWVKTMVFNGQPVPRWPRFPTDDLLIHRGSTQVLQAQVQRTGAAVSMVENSELLKGKIANFRET